MGALLDLLGVLPFAMFPLVAWLVDTVVKDEIAANSVLVSADAPVVQDETRE